MGIAYPLGLEVVPYPHALYTLTFKHKTEEQHSTSLKEHNIFLFFFQNPSEVSDEELNDDLLQSDDEEVDIR